jgi:hypothetical protein
METSVQVKILILFGVAAVLSAFVLSWRATTKFRRLISWIQATYPAQWDALPWTLRQILRGAAVEGLRHRGLGNDREFARRYDELKRLQRWMVALLIVGSTAVGIVVFGTQFGGWSW